MTVSRSALFAILPPVWPEDVREEIRTELTTRNRQLVVLDDDPTGTQTVHDVAVVTRWDRTTLREEFARRENGFFILTNSRSLEPAAARALNLELAANVRAAAAAEECEFTFVSRSDSTLRGHFPLETDALSEAGGPFDATVIAPYFEAGGRYTIGDVHYVAEGDALTPAAETPFARDRVFGYANSNLRAWVEEKTGGRVKRAQVRSLSIELIRRGGPHAVMEKLLAVPRGGYVVVNAAAPRDMEVVALATLLGVAAGRRFLFRTAAQFVSARLGIAPRPCLERSAFRATRGNTGGLIVAGSYVPKTTEQLVALRSGCTLTVIELDVAALLDPARAPVLVAQAITGMNEAIAAGHDTLVSTSRTLITGETSATSLAIGETVSRALVEIVQGLASRPRYVLAKGGITSSDIATRALGVRRAMVRGQLLPGVPVWQLGPETRFPGVDYIVFPGNVGDRMALQQAVSQLQTRPVGDAERR